MSAITIRQMASRVEGLLSERLGARGASFEAKLRHRGKALPLRVRNAARVLAQAAEVSTDPQFLAVLDHAELAAQYDICLRYLGSPGPILRRKVLNEGLLRVGIGFFLCVAALISVLLIGS